MKIKLFFECLVLILLVSTSCSPGFYQVYKAEPVGNMQVGNNSLFFEDENCVVSYNLWDEGGSVGFRFYNKTDKDIFLNLDESFFILNGEASDYFKNRVFTNSSSSGSTVSKTTSASKTVAGINNFDLFQTNGIQEMNNVGFVSSAGFSVSYHERKSICIPSKTSKRVIGFKIKESIYRDCDLFLYPRKSQIKSVSFLMAESPIVFSNRIAYTIDQSDEVIKVENKFYISEITNYPKNEFVESNYSEFCGQKSMTKYDYFKTVSPDRFYIKYIKGPESMKH